MPQRNDDDSATNVAVVIHLWSAPRCMSTSFMYAFAQHPEVGRVLDEPLYAHYLRVTNIPRPYTDQVMQSQNPDGDAVVTEHLLPDSPANTALSPHRRVVFIKHIAKQRAGLSASSWRALTAAYPRAQMKHVVLIRDPYAILKSFNKVVRASLHESAYPDLLQVYSDVREHIGEPPVVISSEMLQRDPKGILSALCDRLGLAFSERMLEWPRGPKPYDGVWAPWWYARTHTTTGFEPFSGETTVKVLAPELRPALEECRPFHQLLARHALMPNTNGDGEGKQGIKAGTHAHAIVPENEHILIGMRDGSTPVSRLEMVYRPDAKVSVFDSAFMLGDGVWEGLRLHRGVLLFAPEHMDRLFQGAKALDMALDFTPETLLEWIYQTVDANAMHSPNGPAELAHHGVHIRVMVSRGLKPTPYQNPRCTIGWPNVVIVPEYKQVSSDTLDRGLRLITTYDPMWNSHSKLNCIHACIQANTANADEALMLDPNGFVSTCNSTNFFIVRRGDRDWKTGVRELEVWAPTAKYQLHGITRHVILRLCREQGVVVREKDFSLTEVYDAAEAFVTGTFAGLIPVTEVDGRAIGDGNKREMTNMLQQLYRQCCDAEASLGRIQSA